MVCCPFQFDQPTNRKLAASVDRKEVAERSNGLRNEMKKMRRMMDEDGSTHKSFHQFLKEP